MNHGKLMNQFENVLIWKSGSWKPETENRKLESGGVNLLNRTI
ncbi:hypothetical protein [Christiangramia antarctica]|uniref:Uncharacterized protein n=1 Tax=Christiangramia antarctica TaxID=2058158 RepID=A0ABW5X2F4_9FLAO